MKMARREFLEKAGLGTIVLGSLPILANAFPTPARASEQAIEHVGFRFVSVSQGNTTANGVQHRVNISGDGEVTPAVSPVEVAGNGSFDHFDNATAVPKHLLAFGTWKARSLVSFTLIGTYGALASAILEMNIDLIPAEGPVTPAALKVVCNIGAAGFNTGQSEGAFLTIPSAPLVGTFKPLEGLAISIFTTGVEERD
jgi:hypothetical protein